MRASKQKMENTENKIAIINKDVPAREIGTITAEIWELRHQAQCMALHYAVEIGRRLDEAKRALKHGEWGDWLQNEVEFSKSSAYNFMKLYYEYGSCEALLSGEESNFQSIGNLPYSKALLLLAIPSEEREEFAEQVHADSLSASELKRAIADRKRSFYASDEDRNEEMSGCQLSEAEPQETRTVKGNAEDKPAQNWNFFGASENEGSPDETPYEKAERERKYEEQRMQDAIENEEEIYMGVIRLIPELRQIADEEKITAVTGASLSYLDEDTQRMVFSSMMEQDAYPTLDQACRLLKLYLEGKLTKESIDGILMEESIVRKKKALEAIIPYLPESLADSRIDSYIIEALKAYEDR